MTSPLLQTISMKTILIGSMMSRLLRLWMGLPMSQLEYFEKEVGPFISTLSSWGGGLKCINISLEDNTLIEVSRTSRFDDIPRNSKKCTNFTSAIIVMREHIMQTIPPYSATPAKCEESTKAFHTCWALDESTSSLGLS
jgi:hypothetical protein